ncbi:MAG: 4-hydroxy-tetrahydrodipicolinate reductase [Acidobacteriaceae bacterium]|nr:4-hydroxy-tetrahydrodipicolinate reductase [Acidobacteriaceae bacterium]
MNLLVLGRGKTGVLVAQVGRERGHEVRAMGTAENKSARGLTRDSLRDIDVVIDFTTPSAVMENIAACVAAGANIVVGTTGWYEQIPRVRSLVAEAGTGLLYASNFSVGVNLFFDIARAASAALQHGYSGKIVEAHHALKKDKPSGTAAAIGRIIAESSNQQLPIESIREGDIVGIHQVELDSAGDRIVLKHEAKSRRGFAEGAIKAAEWLRGKKGFYDFQQVWREI